jgi:hypothetical protein
MQPLAKGVPSYLCLVIRNFCDYIPFELYFFRSKVLLHTVIVLTYYDSRELLAMIAL